MTTVNEMALLEKHSIKWFNAAFEDCNARPEAIAASIRICKAYGIYGQSDPAYIANVIEAEISKQNNS